MSQPPTDIKLKVLLISTATLSGPKKNDEVVAWFKFILEPENPRESTETQR